MPFTRHFTQRSWLKLKNWVQESDWEHIESCRPLFCIKISRTWRHSVICGQPIVGTKLSFSHRVYNGWPKRYSNFRVDSFISLADVKKKTGRGAKKYPSLGRGLRNSSNAKKDKMIGKIWTLLLENGYSKHILSRLLREARNKRNNLSPTSAQRGGREIDGYLCLTYLDEQLLCKIKSKVKRSGLNIKLASKNKEEF